MTSTPMLTEIEPIRSVDGLNHEPWPFQYKGAAFLASKGRAIIADEYGLGKTIQALMAQRKLKAVRVLILCGKNAQWAWISQARKWGFGEPKLVRGQAHSRAKAWKDPNPIKATTPAALNQDIKAGLVPQDWDLIIIDEAHKFCKKKTRNHKNAAWLRSRYLFILSGNRRPLLKPERFWGWLNLLYPSKFKSYWAFIHTHCIIVNNGYGNSIEGVKDPEAWRALLRQYVIRRRVVDVRPEMPPLRRHFPDIEMNDVQARMYKQMRDKAILVTSSAMVVAPNKMAEIVRCRQILCCPRIIDPNCGDDGAGLDYIIDAMNEGDPHVVIFTPFTSAFPYIASRLEHEGYSDYITLQGGIDPEELGRRTAYFTAKRCPAIVSIQFAESFDLNTASRAFMLGYEWDADANLQAEKRLHRGIIASAVDINYFVHKGTYDHAVLAVLDKYGAQSSAILGSRKFLMQALNTTDN
jgi:hypothetical protein